MTLGEIEKQAEAYAATFNPQKLAPFPYVTITNANDDLEILFVELEDDGVAGVILYDSNDKKFTILINNEKPLSYQHLTLAHELAHYVLHKKTVQRENGIVDTDNHIDNIHQTNSIEIEANRFATSLLMPLKLVEEAWDATTDIERCAQIFDVPAIAMSIRLTELGLIS